MNKIDQLFIRACKLSSQGDCLQRLRRVYKRFYLREGDCIPHICGVLLRLCEEHSVGSLSKVLIRMHPSEQLFSGIEDEDSYEMKVVKVLLGEIRYSHRDNFKGMQIPTRFK